MRDAWSCGTKLRADVSNCPFVFQFEHDDSQSVLPDAALKGLCAGVLQ